MTCAAMFAVAALMVVPVAAQTSVGTPPTSCSTEPSFFYDKAGNDAAKDNGQSSWDVEVIDGPCPVACPSHGEAYSSNGENPYTDGNTLPCNIGETLCTGILYGVTATGSSATDLVGILARGPLPYGFGEYDVSGPCEGDPDDLMLGMNSCHEQLISYIPADGPEDFAKENGYDFVFAVVGEGNRDISSTTVAVAEEEYYAPSARSPAPSKENGYGYYVEYCEILGLGREIPDSCVPACGNYNANQTITKTEVLDFKGCKVQFVFDLNTGAVLDVALFEDPEEPSPPDCDLAEFGIGALELDIPGSTTPAKATFGEALVSAGTESCSCRIIGGRVYCWGRNCPQ